MYLGALFAFLLPAATSFVSAVTFTPVYAQGDPGSGIAGYNLLSPDDKAFAFDYQSSGRLDHIVTYRPGTGTIWILENINHSGTWSPVYAQGDPGSGIGGFDLKSTADRVLAFDWNHSGKQDHLVLYRPGTGIVFVVQRGSGNTFAPVFASVGGIGGYDLLSPNDRIEAFDYDHSGKLDHLVAYRPGSGAIFILKNTNGVFSPVYAQGDPGLGIGGYNLRSPDDKLITYDFQHTGRRDHLALYRPGTGTIWILENNGGVFTAVYAQGAPGNGIAGYNLLSPADLVFSFDLEGDCRPDDLALYRPGTGTFWVVSHTPANTFQAVFATGDPGVGIGGYDLKSSADRAFALDYEGSGHLNYVVTYRPGRGAFWISRVSV